jgi:hypothetical protein
MIPVAVVGFLIGAVLAWVFRVWVLIPVTVIIFVSLTIFHLSAGTLSLATVAGSFLVALVPQLGYAFGLVARAGLLILRPQRKDHAVIFTKRRPATSN